MNCRLAVTGQHEPRGGNRPRILALLGLFTAAALVLYSVRGLGQGIAALSIILLAVMEATLLYWIYGRTDSADRRLFVSVKTADQSRIAKREDLSLSALRGRAYSQERIFSELKSVLIERICAAKKISLRQMRELAAADGRKLFGSDLLLRLYSDGLMETGRKRMKALPAGKFLELFNRLAEEILEVK